MKKCLCGMAAVALLGVLACDNGESTGTTTDPATGAAEVPAAAEPDVEPTAEELPIPEDFADEAEQAVTEENYREELARLAAEIEADLEAGGSAE